MTVATMDAVQGATRLSAQPELWAELDVERRLTPRGFVKAGRAHGLGAIDLRLLAFVVEGWLGAQPESLLEPAELSLFELAQGIYRRQPGGEERRLVREALERLYSLDVPLQLTDDSAVVESTRLFCGLGLPDGNATAAAFGAHKGNPTVRVFLAPVLAEQARAGHLDWLGAVPLRELQAVAERLWLWLEEAQFRPGGVGYLEARIELSDSLLETLGVRAARPVDARVMVKRAGVRVVEADRRYSAITVERGAHGWDLIASRRGHAQERLIA